MPLSFEHAACGAVEFDDAGVIGYANATLAGWLERAPAELVGCKFESTLSVANKIFFQTHLFPLLRLRGNVEEIFLTLLSAQGERVPVVLSGRRVETPAGICNQCILLTVHQRRKYEDEILQAKEAAETALRTNEELRLTKESLAARARELERKVREVLAHNDDLQRVTRVLSHDLREPIRKIGLFADLVRGHLAAEVDGEAIAGLQKVDSEATHMEEVINAVRQYLQLDTTAPLEEIEVAPLVATAARSVSMKLKFNDWVVGCDGVPALLGRRAQLLQLFVQLLENAVKFREPSRRLRVTIRGRVVQDNAFAATPGHYDYVNFVQLEVEDNGTGFDPKYREYAFEFMKKVRLDSPGLGIGLAVCRKIVALHYGTIDVDTAPGRGATFIVRLPLTQ
jgi:phosphoserine phosphatase RsbU/P